MNELNQAPQAAITGEDQGLFTPALAALQGFAGRIGARLRSGYEAMLDTPRSAKVYAGLGATTGLALFNTAPAFGSAGQDCIDSGALKFPTTVKAEMLHPGSTHGLTQTINTQLQYPDATCAPDARRFGQLKLQVRDTAHDRWFNITPDWLTVYTRDDGGVGGYDETPTGHEAIGDLVYWHPGDKFRVLERQKVKDLQTGRIAGLSRTKKVGIKIVK